MTTGFNVVDSSAWLEFLGDGPNADEFAPAIEDTPRLIVPAVVITEVIRRLDITDRRQIVPDVLAHMRRGEVVAFDGELAVDATPGCALGVYQDGAVRYARGYGLASLEHSVPIEPAVPGHRLGPFVGRECRCRQRVPHPVEILLVADATTGRATSMSFFRWFTRRSLPLAWRPRR